MADRPGSLPLAGLRAAPRGIGGDRRLQGGRAARELMRRRGRRACGDHPVGRAFGGQGHVRRPDRNPVHTGLGLGRPGHGPACPAWPAGARCLVVAPATANTLARLASRPGRRPADQRRLLDRRAARWWSPRPCTPRCGSTRPRRRTSTPCGAAGSGRRARIEGPLDRAATRARAAWPSRRTSSPRARRGAARRPPGFGAGRACRVLVTAGGTREPIDAVRFIGNRSSGRMGVRRGRGARARGARGHRSCRGRSTVARPPGSTSSAVETAERAGRRRPGPMPDARACW